MTAAFRIGYGISGEGRGHATRSSAIIDNLQDAGHNVTVFTSGDALKFFSDRPGLVSYEIPRLRHIYRGLYFDRPSTVLRQMPSFLKLSLGLGTEFSEVVRTVQDCSLDLVISDFEPFTARTANRLGLPVILIDHQHSLIYGNSTVYSPLMRIDLKLVKYFMGRLFRADKIISNAFFNKPGHINENVFLAQQVLRRAVSSPPGPITNDNIVVYLKRPIYFYEKLAPLFSEMPQECFHVFSDFNTTQIARWPSQLNVQLHPISESEFIRHLKSCKAVICTAGNQTIGEAIYLGKPVFALPEPNAFEQEINGQHLERIACGRSVKFEKVGLDDLRAFFKQLERYRVNIELYQRSNSCAFDATNQVLTELDMFIRDNISENPTTERDRHVACSVGY